MAKPYKPLPEPKLLNLRFTKGIATALKKARFAMTP